MNTGNVNENDYPKIILEDFEIFLNYVKDHPVKLTKTRNYITKKDLRKIHLLLTEHEPLITEFKMITH
ncbi:hypothetical protein P5G51_006785 [Virgibacillus sp. 179-BFC.A HS]|uniref:Uncharacterized protein n=1 Tax=Tigheibacillus jepli TaxID=3035914 RepID=A0ABU5CHZ8_9BACI|nr:hypothetical protein [Virgibacillus sp. 179-BFC.A HS]MDY0405145.1 hypothetical protein [Virgibacillus sp. 179-BFC.A HS]